MLSERLMRISPTTIRPHRSIAVTKVVLVLALALLLPGRASAACSKVDHSHAAWTAILDRWVDDGRVDYAAIRSKGADQLDAYLATLSGVCAADYETWSRDQRLAFWINAYNAFMVKQVLEHYPITSVRKIGWLPGAAFRSEYIPMPELEGGSISLDDIEHDTLRADFDEPRIHFALVCAARSCPQLRSEAYRAADLSDQLDDQGRRFLGNSAKNRFDAATQTLYLSSIFKWFRGDFEGKSGSLKAFVAPYMKEPAVTGADVEIEFLDYDWSLNE